MDVSKKLDFRTRKFLIKHRYSRRFPKRKQRAPVMGGLSDARRNHGNGNAPNLYSSFILSIDDFLSASERKIKMFNDKSKHDDKCGSTVMWNQRDAEPRQQHSMPQLQTIQSVCPRIGKKTKRTLTVFRTIMPNDTCRAIVISSRCTTSDETRACSSAQDTFAVNVKSMVIVCAIGVGQKHNVQLFAIIGASCSFHCHHQESACHCRKLRTSMRADGRQSRVHKRSHHVRRNVEENRSQNP